MTALKEAPLPASSYSQKPEHKHKLVSWPIPPADVVCNHSSCNVFPHSTLRVSHCLTAHPSPQRQRCICQALEAAGCQQVQHPQIAA